MEPASVLAIAVIVAATAYAFVWKALLSLTYAIAFMAVYAIQVASTPSQFFFSPVELELGLFFNRGGWPEPWTWITYAFVHGSTGHLFLNVLAIVFISPVFEGRVGTARWAPLFFGGVVFGALVFRFLHPDVRTLLVGASGGISAVFGAYGRLYPRDRVRLFLPLPGMPGIPVIYVVIGFLLIETFLTFAGPPGIAWAAHVAAMALGFAVAPAVTRLPIPGRRPKRLASLASLRDLAATPALREMLEEAERADLPETRDAWIDRFVREALCPQCDRPLRRRFGRLTSECGWRRSIQ